MKKILGIRQLVFVVLILILIISSNKVVIATSNSHEMNEHINCANNLNDESSPIENSFNDTIEDIDLTEMEIIETNEEIESLEEIGFDEFEIIDIKSIKDDFVYSADCYDGTTMDFSLDTSEDGSVGITIFEDNLTNIIEFSPDNKIFLNGNEIVEEDTYVQESNDLIAAGYSTPQYVWNNPAPNKTWYDASIKYVRNVPLHQQASKLGAKAISLVLSALIPEIPWGKILDVGTKIYNFVKMNKVPSTCLSYIKKIKKPNNGMLISKKTYKNAGKTYVSATYVERKYYIEYYSQFDFKGPIMAKNTYYRLRHTLN